jgi:hypothetical protein
MHLMLSHHRITVKSCFQGKRLVIPENGWGVVRLGEASGGLIETMQLV